MGKNFSLTRSRMWRTRAATALAAAGALAMSGGLVILSAPTASAGGGSDECQSVASSSLKKDEDCPPPKDECDEGQSLKSSGSHDDECPPPEDECDEGQSLKSSGSHDDECPPPEDECDEGQSLKSSGSHDDECPPPDDKKVVVCKYVGTPPGHPDHIIVVNKSAIKDWNGTTFPWTFADAQDSVAIRYAVGNEQPGDEELVNCPERRTQKTPAGINTDDPCGPTNGNVTWTAKNDGYFTYTEANGVVTATLKEPDKYVASGQTSWKLSDYEENEPCPFPPCPGTEQPTVAGFAAVAVNEQTPGCFERKSDARLSCQSGRETRNWTEFRPWVWNEELKKWELGAVEVSGDSGWVFDRPLTSDEFNSLQCQPGQPQPSVRNLSDQRLTCVGGVEQRSGTQTTSYVWNPTTHVYDAVVGAEVWGSWTFVRVLDDAEFQRLQCQPGQPGPVVKPLSGERMSCEVGVEGRSGTQTTTFVWNPTTRVYDEVVGAEVWGDWTFVRELTSGESQELDCVLGSESAKPRPHKTPKPDNQPTVLGTQTGAPTAVDAGLASLPGDTASSTTSLLAQLMVAGGLLLLLAGGWLGLGRREYGEHQA